jgi:Protein of unknown function (DUF1587)
VLCSAAAACDGASHGSKGSEQSATGGSGDVSPTAGGNGGPGTATNGWPEFGPTKSFQLRRLTNEQYVTSVKTLLGVSADAMPPIEPVTPVAGFTAIGASSVSVSGMGVAQFENAARFLADAAFGATGPREKLAGCTPTGPSDSACLQSLVTSFQWEALNVAQMELLVFSLACDQTRVFTYRFSPCNDFTVYPGFPTFVIDPTTTNTGTSMHGMTHSEGGDQPGVQKCVTFSMSKLAALLERLLATPEGAGSLLDNCAILGFTECTEGRSHNAMSQPGIPMIVAGRAGGSLVHPGIHYKSPDKGDQPSEGNGRNVSVVPLTLMQALDTGITSWGEGPGQATKVISELLV